jgi:hypothetical protein
MMLVLQRLRRDEEGQTLVLAAVFGLILCLCVLGTVNVGRAVYDKVQLQTAADNAAYSQAAVAARVMNFTAYTNRAMVVHYASIMAMSAYLTYFHFLYGLVEPAIKLLQFVPYVGPAFKVVKQILEGLLTVLNIAVAIVTPVVAAANVILYGLQEGAWYSFMGRLASIPPEAHSGDSNARPYRGMGGVWGTILTAANQATWAQARGSALMPANTWSSFRIMLNANDPTIQQARMHMVEIANSARSPWVAYGDRANNPSLSFLARHWWMGPSWGGLGTVSRTEMGSFPPGGIVSSVAQGGGEVWSMSRLEAAIDKRILGIRVRGNAALFSVATIDHFFGEHAYALGPKADGGGLLGRFLARILTAILGGMGIFQAMASDANQGFNRFGTRTPRLFWISPYVYYAPRASARAGIGPLGRPGNFAQPDVIVGLNKPATAFNSDTGASRIFGRRFTSRMGGPTGTTDFRMGNAATLPTLPAGLNAFSAAQVYYHRPGDWQEMPNLFNPLWGARLMPVLESTTAAKMALTNNALFRQFIVH